MVNYMTMLVVNIADAKARLSQYLELVENGERVVISRRNRPVAELRAVAQARTEPRPVGLARGQVDVPGAFFEALPDDLVDAFEGVTPTRRPKRERVAEPSPSYEAGRRTPTRRKK
jgi:prevent-host-death family protein